MPTLLSGTVERLKELQDDCVGDKVSDAVLCQTAPVRLVEAGPWSVLRMALAPEILEVNQNDRGVTGTEET